MAHKTREILMLVPRSADGFRANIGVLCSLDGGNGVCFSTVSFTNDRRLRPLLKTACKSMPHNKIREEHEALHTNVQAVMHLWSKR